jgi:hypothetical protein
MTSCGPLPTRTGLQNQSNPVDNKTRYCEINYSFFTLLRDNGTKAVCCVVKETQQCCTIALLCNSAPTSRCYGNHNTQQFVQNCLLGYTAVGELCGRPGGSWGGE